MKLTTLKHHTTLTHVLAHLEVWTTLARKYFGVMVLVSLGLLILGVSGFHPMDFAHNAAHDARHSFAFPCH